MGEALTSLGWALAGILMGLSASAVVIGVVAYMTVIV